MALTLIGRRPRRRYADLRGGGYFAAPGYARPSRGGAVLTAPSRTEAVYETPNQWRTMPVGIEALAVAAGASTSATQNPQVIFRPQRLVVAATNAPSFTVDDIKVGNKSQLVANGSIPADAFIPNASDGIELLMDTCQVSQDLIVEVTNQSAGALDFRAAFIGQALT